MPARLLTALFIVIALAAVPGCESECSPTEPCQGAINLAGSWSGSSTYINAPFTMSLQQSGTTVTGHYQDRKDAGSVSGSEVGPAITLDVNFGDTGIRLTGSVASNDRVSGEILVPVLGGQRFPFEMVR